MRETKSKSSSKKKSSAPVDAWSRLVLRSMSVSELQRESANVENSDGERAAMRDELRRRDANSVLVRNVAGETKRVARRDFAYGSDTHRALIEGGWQIVEQQ